MSDDTRDARIDELERDVARLRCMLDAQGLPGTLRHQTRATLGLMRAILRRSAATASSVETYAAHLEGRFDALLRIQTQLIAKADAAIDLHTLIGDEMVAHTIHEGSRLSLHGPSVEISANRAELIALAIHELTVNAVKFGAMTVPSGHIAIAWTEATVPHRSLHLDWTETGMKGLPPEPGFRGFGIEALENMLRYQFDAESTLVFRPEGLKCMIRLPLPPLPQSPA